MTCPKLVLGLWGAVRSMNYGSHADLFPGVAFQLNDAVEVVDGEYLGRCGSVIALVTREPEPVYLIEWGDGRGDIELAEGRLTAVE